jgi:hypothetical protein
MMPAVPVKTMPPANSNTLERLLDQLDDLKSRFGDREQGTVEKLLSRSTRLQFKDAEVLLRYHEILLFLRAYPHSENTLGLTERELSDFARRIEQLEASEVDLSGLEHPEVSGIAGMSVTDTFSYYIVRWLTTPRRQQGCVVLDWDWFEDENRLAETWPRFLPLLEEDALVEANVPYQSWLQSAASHSEKQVAWLIERFESLPKTEREKAELFDSQKLYVRWMPPYHLTRTGMRLTAPKVFYHSEPLIQRRDVSLTLELESSAPPLKLLSPKQGSAILDLTRAASTVRYRECTGLLTAIPNAFSKLIWDAASMSLSWACRPLSVCLYARIMRQ